MAGRGCTGDFCSWCAKRHIDEGSADFSVEPMGGGKARGRQPAAKEVQRLLMQVESLQAQAAALKADNEALRSSTASEPQKSVVPVKNDELIKALQEQLLVAETDAQLIAKQFAADCEAKQVRAPASAPTSTRHLHIQKSGNRVGPGSSQQPASSLPAARRPPTRRVCADSVAVHCWLLKTELTTELVRRRQWRRPTRCWIRTTAA